MFEKKDRSTSIGGLTLTTGITNVNLYAMVEILVLFEGEYVLRSEGDRVIQRDNSPLLPGNYYLDSPSKSFKIVISLHNSLIDPSCVNRESVLTRAFSYPPELASEPSLKLSVYKIEDVL